MNYLGGARNRARRCLDFRNLLENGLHIAFGHCQLCTLLEANAALVNRARRNHENVGPDGSDLFLKANLRSCANRKDRHNGCDADYDP